MLDPEGSDVTDEHCYEWLEQIFTVDAHLNGGVDGVGDVEPELAGGERGLSVSARVKEVEDKIGERRVVGEVVAVDVEDGEGTPEVPPSGAENAASNRFPRL